MGSTPKNWTQIAVVVISATVIVLSILAFYNTIFVQDITLRPRIGLYDYEIRDIKTEKAGWLGEDLTRRILIKELIYDEGSLGKRLQFELHFIFENYGSTPAFETNSRFTAKLGSHPSLSDLPTVGGKSVIMPGQKVSFTPTITGDAIQKMISENERLFFLIRIEYSYPRNILTSGNGYYQLLGEITPDNHFVLQELVG